MPNYNKLEIIGHLGRDPETRSTQNGKSVTSFTVAVNTGGQNNKETTWFKVSAWERLSEIASKYLKKGNAVFVAGPVKLTKYKGQDGNEYTNLEVTARELVLLGSKDDAPQGGGGQSQHYSKTAPPEDDIPF